MTCHATKTRSLKINARGKTHKHTLFFFVPFSVVVACLLQGVNGLGLRVNWALIVFVGVQKGAEGKSCHKAYLHKLSPASDDVRTQFGYKRRRLQK